MTGGLPANAQLAGIRLRVRDPEPMLAHYRDLLGLELVEEVGQRLVLAPEEGRFQLELEVAPEARLRPRPSVGLYHMAFLVPSRADLAGILEHLSVHGIRLQAADHGVSEALYLSDPEGNGIELYRDRPPEAWPRRGDEVAMVTDPLDLEALAGDSPGPQALPGATTLGHIHLHVPELAPAVGYLQALGLHVSQSTYPGVTFLAVGGYHHHVAVNTWAGQRQAPKDATGLLSYTWQVPEGTLAGLEDHLEGQGLSFEGGAQAGELVLQDPVGHHVLIRQAPGSGE